MHWLTQRQTVLSENVANADTPDFVPRDMKKGAFAGMVRSSVRRVETAATHVNHLGGADASFLEVIREIGDLTGEKVPDKPVSAWALRLAARIIVTMSAVTGRQPNVTPEGVAMVLEHPRIVSDKAERELGYKPASLRAMLEDTHGWLKAEGLLN